MSVWATYVKRNAESQWRLEAFSVQGAERARALVEREHAKDRVVGAEYRVQQFASLRDMPDRLDG
jgi:hypothetical protein